VIRTQPRPLDPTCLFIDGMRKHRKRMHIQPNTRTVETHRRPPDLQLWLYRCECSPAIGNPRPIAARGLRPRVSLHTNLALAAAVLSAQRKTHGDSWKPRSCWGGLALDGRVRPVRGVLPAVLAAKVAGWGAAVVSMAM
jgi:hypothetical protein